MRYFNFSLSLSVDEERGLVHEGLQVYYGVSVDQADSARTWRTSLASGFLVLSDESVTAVVSFWLTDLFNHTKLKSRVSCHEFAYRMHSAVVVNVLVIHLTWLE